MAPIIRCKDGEIELVELHWGLRRRDPDAPPLINLRSDGRDFPTHRCLVEADQFFFSQGHGRDRTRWRFSLANGESFYFAGIWRPAQADWPESYAVLTIPSNPDVLPYHDRQMAVILRHDAKAWLECARPEEDLLRPLPAGSFRLDQVGRGR